MTDATALDAQLAAAPDAASRAALLGIDFAAFERTSRRLNIAVVVISIASALTVVGIGALFYAVPIDDQIGALAVGILLGLVPFILSLVVSVAVVQALRPRLSGSAPALLGGVLSAGLAAVLTVVAVPLLQPLGETVMLGFAAGLAVGAAMPVLSIASLPAAFRRPNPKLAAGVAELRSRPAHLTTFDGRIAHLVADHSAWQFLFVALVPITVANVGAGVAAALVLAGVCALTARLDLRGGAAASLLVSIAAAGVFLAAAIVAAG